MLPSVGYFKTICCPYFENDNCERPYCQFRHEKFLETNSFSKDQVPGTSKVEPNQEHDKALAIEQIVSEAVKRVLNENGQLLRNFDASKIMELVGQQKLVEKVVEHLAPPSSGSQLKSETEASNLKAKSHKVYTIPVGTPAYTPTPLAVLKRTKPVGSKDDNYVPSSSESKCTATYQPSKFKSSQVDEYSPSPLDLAPDVNYTPSSRDLNNIINDQYTPLSNTLSDVDYQPTDKALSSTEPSYTPSFSASAEIAQIGSGIQVDYSPSSITTLTKEPGYTPAPSSQPQQANYTPSSLCLKGDEEEPISPEKYLAMLESEILSTDLEVLEPATKKSSHQKERKSSREGEEKRRKEKERSQRKEKERRERKSDSSSDKKRKEEKSSSRSSDSQHKSKSSSSKESSRSRSSSSHSKVSKSKSDRSRTDKELDSDVDEECYRIFQEYKPDPTQVPGEQKRRKSEDVTPAVEDVIPVKKQRIAHAGSSELRPSSSQPIARPPAKLSPGMMMIERFKKMKELKEQGAAAAAVTSSSTPSSTPSSMQSSKRVAHVFNGSTTPSSEGKKRIAHVPNVSGLLTAKPRVAPSVGTVSSVGSVPPAFVNPFAKKVPIGLKSTKPPSAEARQCQLPRPVIAIELGCRVPATVRQRYLNVLIDELLKIYDQEQDAYDRAVSEESQCYARSNSKTVYLNVVVNIINRIRKERESATVKSDTNEASSERKIQSHAAVLIGKNGANVSWSIEKSRSKIDPSLLSGAPLFKLLNRYILTMEQQEFNGYPRPDPKEKGRATVNTTNKFRAKPNVHLTADQRLCDRCATVYRVDSRGIAVLTDKMCSYHWGRGFQRRGETRYSCCQGDSTSDGCCVAKYHVSDTMSAENMKGFVSTLSKSTPADGNYGVYALDCEMCYTTEGPELTRVTVVSSDCQTVYESLVKPDNPIVDYNTRFSGITEEDLKNVRTTIRDVQAVLLSYFSDKTILIGHSFDSDLRALRLIHNTVIDTSVVFPHPRGPPYKKALRTLCGEILQKIIQNGVDGHDSAEDAIACMELMIWKVKQDLKNLK